MDIGDRIEFLLSGRSITLTIANIRESTRQGFQPFFYFSFDPVAFATAPKTYFASPYASDTELWKKNMLGNSGPHVTFVDVENILSLVRDISNKVLSVIGLFVGVISLFALFAVVSFFARMRSIESLKSRLYKLFGLLPLRIMHSLRTTRMSVFIVSLMLSLLLSTILVFFVFRASTILTFSWASVGIVSLGAVVVYAVLVVLLRPKI